MAMLVLLVRRCYPSRGTCCSVAYLKATHKGKSRIYIGREETWTTPCFRNLVLFEVGLPC